MIGVMECAACLLINISLNLFSHIYCCALRSLFCY